jgi:cbb3-type cytochrome oxidase subunit 3
VIGTLFFFGFFLLVLVWTLTGGRARYESASRLPLDETPSAACSTRLPDPSDD